MDGIMGKASFSLPKLAIFLALLACVTVPTFGVSNGDIRMPQKAKIIVEELVVKKPEPMSAGVEIEMVQLQPKFMEIGQQGKVLQCVGAGSYCNSIFGPQCCNSILACIPGGLVGGVCIA